ncbi:MAG: aminodeoxychorismate synthase component I [Burkholderiales bacterium]|nr:aminodeoxychorismate synthase component I [Burkholderiales bacterium]
MPTQLAELPYREDSAASFEAIADLPWAVFLDSGAHNLGQSRYDILAAEPYLTMTTRGKLTEIRGAVENRLSPDDPFDLLRAYLRPAARQGGEAATGMAGRHHAATRAEPPFTGGAIGYFGYDLGRRLERLPAIAEDAEKLPEMAIGFYDWALVVDHLERRTWLAANDRDPATAQRWPNLLARFEAPVAERFRAPFRITAALASNMTRAAYDRAFHRIQDYIRAGDCYQVNLAQRFAAPATGDPWLAYQALRIINPAPFAAYLNTPGAQILCASPERFLKVDGNGHVETKPIKGTRPRAGHPRLDAALGAALQESEKDRAENLMIVDLLRNDLSKNCALGSVRVPKLFAIESFATVHHLVSTVVGELAPGKDAIALLRGCFPGGSITGAPKLRAMEIIEQLEPNRRGIYCGAIGYIGFDGGMDTNIAIRTLVYSVATGGAIRFWAGGGIVADSRVDDEYQETLDKGAAMLRLLQQSAMSGVG